MVKLAEYVKLNKLHRYAKFVSKEKASTMFEVVSGHCKNKGNDHCLRKFLIVKQILIVSTIGNAKRSGVKG